MKSNKVFFEISRRLHINPSGLDKVKLADGTIFPSYFQNTLEDINRQIVTDPRNRNMVCEFSQKSVDRWAYLNPNATIMDFARLFSVPSGRTNGTLRAACLKPRVTPQLLQQFLADQMEIPAEQVDLSMKVRDIRLPVADNDAHSWVTFIVWASRRFGQNKTNLNTVADMTVGELFKYWLT